MIKRNQKKGKRKGRIQTLFYLGKAYDNFNGKDGVFTKDEYKALKAISKGKINRFETVEFPVQL
jgi:hypothetical protein